MILGHNLENFFNYFQGAWIDLKNGAVSYVHSMHRQPSTCTLSHPDRGILVVDLKDLTWEQTQPKELGYRNIGKYLFYFDKKAGRNTRKGVSRNTLITTKSLSTLCWSHGREDVRECDRMLALFYPKFPTAKEAMTKLLNAEEQDAIALAISANCALVLDPVREGVILLLMQENTIAEYDYFGWKWLVPHAKDVAERLGVI